MALALPLRNAAPGVRLDASLLLRHDGASELAAALPLRWQHSGCKLRSGSVAGAALARGPEAKRFRVRCEAAAATSAPATSRPSTVGTPADDKVVQVHNKDELDAALKAAKNRLVVVEYGASHSVNSAKIYPTMVEMSRKMQDVNFVLVMGDESDETTQMCKDEGIEKVPHFVFYKNGEKIHEEEGIDGDMLVGDVLYYGDNDAPIHQLHGKEDIEALLQKHAADHQLVVVDVSLKSCGPCVKVYPAVVKLSRKMAGNAVFARLLGDENESCENLMRALDIKEVPTFLFIRDGKLCGRYVGSGRGELVGEVLRHLGVRVTY
eukprot:SM000108S14218  [mRNA]  locus=s108:397422:399998:+ [translate_table: standard]